MSYVEKEKLIKADIASIENRVRHAFNQGYDLGYKEGKERAKAQETTTKNDLGVDCISRKRVLEWLENATDDSIEHAIDSNLEFIPSVTPQEPKTGHWIGHREHCENLGVMPSGLGAYVWCSNCDCGIDVREWHRIYYNYCPNCGAFCGGDNNG